MRRASALLAAALIVALTAPAATADLDSDLKEVDRRITDLESDLASAEASQSGLTRKILELNREIEEMTADLQAARSARKTVRTERKDTKATLTELQDQLQASYLQLAETSSAIDESKTSALEWVRRRYMSSGEHLLEVALVSGDVAEVVVGAEYLQRISAQTNSSINRYQALRAQEERQQKLIAGDKARVEADLAVLATITAQLEALGAELADGEAALQVRLSRQIGLLDELDHEIEHFASELDVLAAEQDRIEELIAAEAVETGDPPGILARPVPGPITSGFGPRFHPILRYTRMHTGVDMTAPHGQRIRAGAQGTVILSGPRGGYGATVIIDHGGGMTTLYAHQSRLGVSYGDRVAAGDVIGEVGSSGLATGAHLHFEVRINGAPVDPADYL